MLSVLLGMFAGLVGWLSSHLPTSPFASVSLVTVSFPGTSVTVSDVLGWVNWLVPVEDMVITLGLWCSALLVVLAARVAYKPVTNLLNNISFTG